MYSNFLIDKDNQIRELKASADLADRLHYEAPCYWLDKPQGRDGPFCQRCYDTDDKLIRLISQRSNGREGYICKTCDRWDRSKESGQRGLARLVRT